jgi:hypothetical protein
MAEQCPHCGKKYAKYPWRDEQGNIIWKNLFKIDWYTLMWLAVVLFLLYGYYHDTAECIEIIQNPITYCEESNACEVMSLDIKSPDKEVDKWFMENVKTVD